MNQYPSSHTEILVGLIKLILQSRDHDIKNSDYCNNHVVLMSAKLTSKPQLMIAFLLASIKLKLDFERQKLPKWIIIHRSQSKDVTF